jgi:hypothetical protein
VDSLPLVPYRRPGPGSTAPGPAPGPSASNRTPARGQEGEPPDTTLPPHSLNARGAPDLQFSVYTVFCPRKTPAEKAPPDLLSPKNFISKIWPVGGAFLGLFKHYMTPLYPFSLDSPLRGRGGAVVDLKWRQWATLPSSGSRSKAWPCSTETFSITWLSPSGPGTEEGEVRISNLDRLFSAGSQGLSTPVGKENQVRGVQRTGWPGYARSGRPPGHPRRGCGPGPWPGNWPGYLKVL